MTHSFIRANKDFPGVQCLRFCTPSAGGPGSIPVQRTRSYMHAATKSLHTATKDPTSCHEDRRSYVSQLTQCSQINRINIFKLDKQQGASTGNSAQYSIITQMGEEFEKDSVQFSSVAQSCLTLCDPMTCSTPGLPVRHQLPEFTQTHVH